MRGAARLPQETQATGQALAKRVLSRLRKERGETETGEKMRDTQRSLRRFRAVVRQVRPIPKSCFQ